MNIGSRTLVVATVAGALAMTTAAHADANSLIDYFGPRAIAVGDAMRADAKGASSIALNPAGLSLTRELVLEAHYGLRPDDSANSVNASVCDSTTPVAGCIYYRFFSASPELGDTDEFDRRAHEVGFSASRALSQRLMFGLTTKYFDYNSDLVNEEDSSGVAWDAGITFLASSKFSVGVAGYNLVTTEESAQYPRGVGSGITLRPATQLAVSIDGLWNLDLPEGQSIGRYGGGAEYFFVSGDRQSGFPIRLGAVHDRALEGTYVTGGLGYRTDRVGVDIGVRQQVDGGEQFMGLVSLRLFSPSGALR